MNIFKFEMRQQRSAVISWTAALSVVCLFFMCLYPAFSNGVASMKDLLANFPKEVLDALNINPDAMTSVFGFFPFALTYTALVGSIGATYFGMGIVSRENREKTADFLLSKPVARLTAFHAKLLAALCSIAIINAVFVATSILWCLIFAEQKFNVATLCAMSGTLFFIQLVFAAIGVFVAVYFRRIKAALPVALVVGFAFFLLSAFDTIINDGVGAILGKTSVDAMQYVSPTKFFDYQAITRAGCYSARPIITTAVWLVILVAASAVWYKRQDVRAV